MAWTTAANALQTRVPPSEARTFLATPPGATLSGLSVAESTDALAVPRRLPTIFSPLHMGHKFQLQTIDTPAEIESTVMFIRNVTLVMPEASFHNLSLTDWFETGEPSLTRVCFGNMYVHLLPLAPVLLGPGHAPVIRAPHFLTPAALRLCATLSWRITPCYAMTASPRPACMQSASTQIMRRIDRSGRWR